MLCNFCVNFDVYIFYLLTFEIGINFLNIYLNVDCSSLALYVCYKVGIFGNYTLKGVFVSLGIDKFALIPIN